MQDVKPLGDQENVTTHGVSSANYNHLAILYKMEKSIGARRVCKTAEVKSLQI